MSNARAVGADGAEREGEVIDLEQECTRDTEPAAVPSIRPPTRVAVERAPVVAGGEQVTRPELIIPPPEARRSSTQRIGATSHGPSAPRVLTLPLPLVVSRPRPPAPTAGNTGRHTRLTTAPSRARSAALLIAGTILGAAATAAWAQFAAHPPASHGAHPPTRAAGTAP